MYRSLTALACVFLARACSPEDCGACSESQCSATEGCRDDSPGDYDARYCLACDGDCNNGPESGGLDASLGCSAQDNLTVSLLLGFMGGAFACLLPCCCLSLRAKRRWSEAFLEPGNPEVLRAQATVQEKLQQTTTNSQGGSTTSYSLKLQFKANEVSVRGEAVVFFEFWEKLQQGAEVEVACREREPRDFVVVENERLQPRGGERKLLGCVLGLFFVVGAAIGGGAVALTGCPLALATLALPLLAGLVCGQFLCMPVTRRMARLRVKAEGS